MIKIESSLLENDEFLSFRVIIFKEEADLFEP